MKETGTVGLIGLKEIYEQYEGKLVLVERHGDYFPTPEQIATGKQRHARVYTREYPDCLCSLNDKGIQTSKAQGLALAELGMIPDSILVSPLARGAQTGLWLQQGLIQANAFAPVAVEPRLAYPVYRRVCKKTGQSLVQIMEEIGDPFPTLILRGELDLWEDNDPETFSYENSCVVSWLLDDLAGFRILCTHWENIVALRMTYTCFQSASLTREQFIDHSSGMYQWIPSKNGGLIFVGAGSRIQLLGEFDPEFRVTPYHYDV